MMKRQLIICLVFMLTFGMTGLAGEADVVDVVVKKKGKNTFDFSVTVRHKDTGWDHYANKWEIVNEEEAVLGTRTLHHPHVDEQPFTRGLSNVQIPANMGRIIVRAHDSIHRYGGRVVTVELP